MRIVTWNINSLNARQDLTARFLDEERPDVLALQELKLETEKVPVSIFASRGYHVAVSGQRGWNGVLLAAKAPIEDVTTGLAPADAGEARLIAGTIAGIRFVNVYCPQGQTVESDKFRYKLGFYDGLSAWIEAEHRPDMPLLMMGDMNVAPAAEDIWDPVGLATVPSFHPLEHERFRRLLAWGLVDVVRPHVPPNTYSFWDYRAGDFHKNHGMRIDHVLATAPVAERVEHAEVLRDWRKKKEGLTPSDHAPVVVRIRA